MQRPEVYELVHSEDIDEERFFQEPIANHRKRHSYIEETLRYLQTRDGLVITVSLAVFGILSAYFHMPCTLYLYLVCVIFTFPLLAINTLLHPQPRSNLGLARISIGCICTLSILFCTIVGWEHPQHAVTAQSSVSTNETIYIVSLLYNSEHILPHYSRSLLQTIEDIGRDRVFVSIFENNSTDASPMLLRKLEAELERRNVAHNINSTSMPSELGMWERIERLSFLRNQAMKPFYDQVPYGLQGRPFTRVLWINNVIFEPKTVHALLQTDGGSFDQACTVDYFWLGYYDIWVLRDKNQKTVRPLWPFFRDADDRRAVESRRPIAVNSCWNGMTAFDARWFSNTSFSARNSTPAKTWEPVISSLPRPIIRNDSSEKPVTLPLQFRTSRICNASESQLTSLDMHRLAHPRRPKIILNSDLVVAYDAPTYYLYQHIMRWRIIFLWHYLWEYWVSTRIFTFFTNMGFRPKDPCTVGFAPLWTTERVPISYTDTR